MRSLSLPDYDRLISAAIVAGDWASVDRWGTEQTELQERTRICPTLAGVALWYADQGLPVFPLQPGQKVPYKGTHGLTDATCDIATVRRWWADRPHSNIAIATGHVVDVIDIDGPTGVQTWADLLGADPEPFGLLVGKVSTPRPGGHHLYRPATGAGNGARDLPGIDYRGIGGYVVAPPSVNAAGTPYRWSQPLQLERKCPA